jgi:Leu/Phe-tRNA-protein transferase
MSVSLKENGQLVLLPEMQFEYALLEFKDLHISKKVQKLLRKNQYEIKINNDLEKTIYKIEAYHKDSWIKEDYKQLLFELSVYDDKSFKLLSFELYDKYSKELIAGEVGYIIEDSYTSLSGFSSKDKEYKNWGKLQLVLLAKYLEKESFKVWNLGHPYMDYKLELGAKVYKRLDFLNKWRDATKKS